MTKFDIAANIAFFLLEKTGSVCGKWNGTLSAKEQREIFGHFIGKGMLSIDGAKETVEHTVKVAFGMDYETTFYATLNDIDTVITVDIMRKEENKARIANLKASHEARINN